MSEQQTRYNKLKLLKFIGLFIWMTLYQDKPCRLLDSNASLILKINKIVVYHSKCANKLQMTIVTSTIDLKVAEKITKFTA